MFVKVFNADDCNGRLNADRLSENMVALSQQEVFQWWQRLSAASRVDFLHNLLWSTLPFEVVLVRNFANALLRTRYPGLDYTATYKPESLERLVDASIAAGTGANLGADELPSIGGERDSSALRSEEDRDKGPWGVLVWIVPSFVLVFFPLIHLPTFLGFSFKINE
jgi:hypothetical protein